jgi:putative transposase
MTRSVTLDARQRQALLDRYRRDPDPDVRSRCHILLLLADGFTWEEVGAALYCSSRTIDRWVKRFHEEGPEAVAGHKPGRRFRFGIGCLAVVIHWVTTKVPTDFGFLRSRWSCGTLALLLSSRHGIDVSPETVRLWLHRGDMVYRRPRPTVGPRDEQREAKLSALRELLAELPPDETVVWQDEADINTNPEIGRMWMRRGQQSKIPTPGTNQRSGT